MRWDVVSLVVGWTLALLSAPLILLAALSIPLDGYSPILLQAFLVPALLSVIFGVLLILNGTRIDSDQRLRDREAFAAVALGWPTAVVVGAIPFWIGGMFHGPTTFFAGESTFIEAIGGLLRSGFESMSVFTTTGATVIDPLTSPLCTAVITDCIGAQPRSLLLWRSLTQWLGGMGIIMLGMLILSRWLGGGMAIAQAELTGPSLSRLRPTLEQTARVLWSIYIVFTLLEFIALWGLTQMNAFHAANYALTTLPTGGFGTTDGGVMDWDSPLVEIIITIFMILAGTNFSLFYLAVFGDGRKATEDDEFKFYLIVLFAAWAFMAINLMLNSQKNGYSNIEAIRHSLFQAASIGTSTGFASSDFAAWPVLSLLILIGLMVVGASAGSTGGGLKILRLRIIFGLMYREISRLIQPRKLVALRFNGEVVEESRILLVIGMLSAWIALAGVSAIMLTFFEPSMSLETLISVVASSLGNTGPALGDYGPTNTWASMHWLTLCWTGLLMWAGRLELLTVLVLLHPRTWKNP
jgi:trk system potassium uptake protein TrkH